MTPRFLFRDKERDGGFCSRHSHRRRRRRMEMRRGSRLSGEITGMGWDV